MTAAEFKYVAMALFGGLVTLYGLWGIWRRKIDFGLRGSMSHKYFATLTGNYAVVAGIGLILGGMVIAVATLLRQQLNISDAVLGVFDALGIIIILGGFGLAALFQSAANLGRDLGKQPDHEK